MFYEFRQNNSGGHFTIDDDAGLGVSVYIEAETAEQAESRAEDIGIYFDGIEKGWDCPCCGDRWYRLYDDGVDTIEVNPYFGFTWHDTIYVHMLSGEIKRIKVS